jgi:4'-phosphopantetheinyl transferase EntD
MVPHHKAETNPMCSSRCFVGALDVCELQDTEYTDHLSPGETATYMRLPSVRKKRWLAGRLAAKFLFLKRLETFQEAPGCRQWRPSLSKLSSEALDRYSPWIYQKIEVLPDGSTPTRHSKLVWCGKDRSESISLSHAGGLSCACIAVGPPTAIDVETAVPRIDAFYRNTFTEAERYWVNRETGGESTRSAWVFTLLWTLKEAALKLGWLNQVSVWDLPRIEIDGLAGIDNIGQLWRSSKMVNDFVVFTARVKKEHSRVMQVQVAVTATRNLILTAMNPLSGVEH